MPKIPTIVASPNAVKALPISPDTFGAQFFGEMGQIAADLQHQQDEIDLNTVKGQYDAGLKDIQLELPTLEPDPMKQPARFQIEAQKLRDRLFSQIKREPVKHTMEGYANATLPGQLVDVKAKSLERWAKSQQAGLSDLAEVMLTEVADAPSVSARTEVINRFHQTIAAAQRRGVLTPEDAQARRKNFDLSVEVGAAMHDARVDPENTIKNINKNYPHLNEIARERIIDRANVELRRRQENDTNNKAAAIVQPILERLTPGVETEPMNPYDVMAAVRKQTKDPAILSSAEAQMRQYVTDWNAKAKKIDDANKSAVYHAATTGHSLQAIMQMPEYQAMNGVDQAAFKEFMGRPEPVDEATKNAQTIRWGQLISHHDLLMNTNLDQELLAHRINRQGYDSLIAAKHAADPLKANAAANAISLIDKAGSAHLFDPGDDANNLTQWNNTKNLVQQYITNYWDKPDYDPAAFANQLLQPASETTAQWWIDFFHRGQPGQVEANQKRIEAINYLIQHKQRITEANIAYVMGQLP